MPGGLDATTILGLATVLAVGSMLQSMSGFGFALFTVPALVLLGCEPYEAIVLVAMSAAAHALAGLFVLRAHVNWKRGIAMVAIASLTIPLGVWVLALLADHDRSLVQRVFGAIVMLALIVHVAVRPKPRDRLPSGTMVGALLASGFMGGMSGMSGPPAVLWVMAHKWSNHESRATLWCLFGGTAPVQLGMLRYQFGAGVTDAGILALMLLPATLTGMLPGLWIGHRLPKATLRTVSLVLLGVIALVALLR